jgi:hypothetical protein
MSASVERLNSINNKKPPLEVINYWKNIGRILERYWKDIGRILERYWKDIGRILERYWKDIGRIFGRSYRETEKILPNSGNLEQWLNTGRQRLSNF